MTRMFKGERLADRLSSPVQTASLVVVPSSDNPMRIRPCFRFGRLLLVRADIRGLNGLPRGVVRPPQLSHNGVVSNAVLHQTASEDAIQKVPARRGAAGEPLPAFDRSDSGVERGPPPRKPRSLHCPSPPFPL